MVEDPKNLGGGTTTPDPTAAKPDGGTPASPATKPAEQNTEGTPEALHDAAIKAVEAWQASPTPESKKAAEDAVAKAKEGFAVAKKAAEEAAAKSKAPEKYEEFKLPQGVTIIPESMVEFQTTAKELGLTQSQAQSLLDLQVKVTQRQAELVDKGWQEQKDSWKAETLKALGADAEKQRAVAAKALERFGTPELRKLLDETGMGEHLELTKFMIAVGKAISEDTLVEGKSRNAGPKDPAKTLYPNLP